MSASMFKRAAMPAGLSRGAAVAPQVAKPLLPKLAPRPVKLGAASPLKVVVV